jgi:hypothetical protein
MKQATLLSNLSSTRRQIEEVKSLIRRQRVILAELIVERRNATAARDALAAMEVFMASLVAHRTGLEKELDEHSIDQRRAALRRLAAGRQRD